MVGGDRLDKYCNLLTSPPFVDNVPLLVKLIFHTPSNKPDRVIKRDPISWRLIACPFFVFSVTFYSILLVLVTLAVTALNIVGLMCIGGLVHGELTQRSRFLFSKQHDPKNMTYSDHYATQMARWLETHDGSILAGSFMPDWYSAPYANETNSQGLRMFRWR